MTDTIWSSNYYDESMPEDITCRVCGWTGGHDDLNHPPTGHEKHYCPECATIIEIE